jgi:hypothetical protein
MALNVRFEPLEVLFDSEGPVPRGLLKQSVLEDFKSKNLVGIPDAQLGISFSENDPDGILISRIDPENALGYSVYASEKDYFDRLSMELYEPSEEDIQGGLGE